MSDEQYAALDAKLDAILARLDALEEKQQAFEVIPTTDWRHQFFHKESVKVMVDQIEQDIAGRFRDHPGYSSGGVY